MELNHQKDEDFDSDDDAFLLYEMPKHISEVPACGCNKKGYCPTH